MAWEFETSPQADTANPIDEKTDMGQCAPCENLFNPIIYSERLLTVNGTDHLNYYVMTYGKEDVSPGPAPEDIVVTVEAPYDDSELILGATICFLMDTKYPVKFVDGAGITITVDGLPEIAAQNASVGLVSLTADRWAIVGTNKLA